MYSLAQGIDMKLMEWIVDFLLDSMVTCLIHVRHQYEALREAISNKLNTLSLLNSYKS